MKNSMKKSKKTQTGFTLVELVITAAVLSILLLILAPLGAAMMSSQQLAYIEKHKLYNRYIADALLSYARNTSPLGMLPSPYSGNGYQQTVYNPFDTSATGIALAQALSEQGLPPAEINDDGTTGANVRVYQLVPNLNFQMPLFVQSGPMATLTYQFGALYLTQCMKSDTSCNPLPATAIPGSSIAMTASNYVTWASSGSDTPAVMLSSLPVQKEMLMTTAQRLDKLRDAFLSHFRVAQMTAAAGDATNFYPSAATSQAGQVSASNQGCHDGWYSLASSDVLPKIGLAASEYGSTAWGGAVEFCRDYDPLGSKVADAPPHSAALRIRASVSSGSAPDATLPGNNLVLTF